MKKPLRTLLVEDNPDDAQLAIDELTQAGYDVTHQRVETAAAMRKALRDQTWDLVLADYALPHFSAGAALWLVKQVGYDVPFIIVSGTITDETAVAAMKAGAHDYVTKDHLARLGPAVKRELAEAALRADRARLTGELHREQDRFRAIVEKSPDALAILDGSGRVAYVSPPIERIAGYHPREWVNQPLREFVHPDSIAAFEADVAEVREKAWATKSGTYRFRHHNGSWRCLAFVLTNLLHEPGVQGLTVSLRDVSAQLCAQEELCRKMALLEAQLDSVRDGILIVDDQGHTLLQNRRVAELLQLPPEAAAPADDPQQAGFARENLRSPQDFARRLEYLYSHPKEVAQDDVELKDGTVLHRYTAPVVGRDGRHYGRMWVFKD